MNTALSTLLQPRVWRLSAGVVFLAVAACHKSDESLGADSSLTKDLALAGQQTATPTFKDTALAPAPTPAAKAKEAPPALVKAPVAKKPPPKVQAQQPQAVAEAPAPQPAPAPVVQTPAPAPAPAPGPAAIGAGTGIAMTGGTKVCTTTNMPGDKIVATTNEAITGANGAVIPAGTNVVLEIASVTPGQDAQSAKLLFRVRSIIVNDKTYNVDGDVTLLAPLDKSKVPNSDPNADKKKVIGGAIIGGILGQMVGHNTKGTVIGAAAGAAAGAVASKTGETWQACLPSGAPMRLTLNSQLVL